MLIVYAIKINWCPDYFFISPSPLSLSLVHPFLTLSFSLPTHDRDLPPPSSSLILSLFLSLHSLTQTWWRKMLFIVNSWKLTISSFAPPKKRSLEVTTRSWYAKSLRHSCGCQGRRGVTAIEDWSRKEREWEERAIGGKRVKAIGERASRKREREREHQGRKRQ